MENKEIIEKEASLPETVEVVGIKFREGGKTYYFSPEGLTVNKDDHVIVETARGREFGICALSNRQVKRGSHSNPSYRVGRCWHLAVAHLSLSFRV